MTFELKGKSEIERRSSYFDKIEDRAGMLIPTIKSCLNNIPKNRASIVQVCSQLEGLVDKQDASTDETDLPSSSLQQEIKRKDAEILKMKTLIQSKDIQIHHQATEIEALKSGMDEVQMQINTQDPTLLKDTLLHRQVTSSKLVSYMPYISYTLFVVEKFCYIISSYHKAFQPNYCYFHFHVSISICNG